MTRTLLYDPELILLDLELDLAEARIRAEEEAVYLEGLEERGHLLSASAVVPDGTVMADYECYECSTGMTCGESNCSRW